MLIHKVKYDFFNRQQQHRSLQTKSQQRADVTLHYTETDDRLADDRRHLMTLQYNTFASTVHCRQSQQEDTDTLYVYIDLSDMLSTN